VAPHADRQSLRLAVTAVVSIGAVSSAAAQEGPLRFELTPYAGHRIGGEFEPQSDSDELGAVPGRAFELDEGSAAGLILDIRTADGQGQWEVLYAHQATELDTQTLFFGGPSLDVDVSHYQFGGAYLFDSASDATVPFLALTAGVVRFDPRLEEMDTESYFSWSLGGGVHLRADRRVGVRLEARVFGNVIHDDSALFCRSSPTLNSCALFVEADVVYQVEARVGLAVRF